MKTLGQSIRELRKSRGLLIREVAAELGIDPSLLSRIERGDKRPTRAQVVQLSEILDANRSDLLADYLSERVVNALRNEEVALQAISLAEKKITTILVQRRVLDAVP